MAVIGCVFLRVRQFAPKNSLFLTLAPCIHAGFDPKGPDPFLKRGSMMSKQLVFARPFKVRFSLYREAPVWLIRLLLSAVTVLVCSALNAAPFDQPMTFSVKIPCEGHGSMCNEYILAQGIITPKTPERFAIFMRKIKPYKPTIYFHSPGGDLVAALKMGHMIRQAGLDTFVGGPYEQFIKLGIPYQTLVKNGGCVSACAYAFLGGVSREVSEGGKYGVHQFAGSRKDTGEGSAQVTSTVLANYLDDMGVDRRLLDIASLTRPTAVQLIKPSLARELNVDNTAPLKPVGN